MRGPAECSLARIGADHDLSVFSCGKGDLDTWLTKHALQSDRIDSSRVFVLLDGERVVGYFALTMGSVSRDAVPSQLVKGMPGYPVGAVVLTRFAIDKTRQGRGFGAFLLARSILLAAQAGGSVAARLLIVDAVDDDAASFYERFGFVALPEHPRRLYVRLADVVQSLGDAGF